MNYRRELDGLRALAVLPVMFFHAGFKAFSGGFVGVDVFFVISGYLITSIILTEKQAGTFSLLNFYERRARRILPALFFVMFVCLPFAFQWLLPRDLKSFSQSLVAVSSFASNILFWWKTGYFDTEAELKPLLHTWSLAVEEQFYLFFPAMLILVWRLGRTWVSVMLAAVFVASLTAAQWGAAAQPVAAFYLLPTRGWELLIGSFLAFYFLSVNRWQPQKTTKEVGGLIGLLLLAYAVIVFDKETPYPSLYTLVPTIGTALIIFSSSQQTAVGKLLGSKLLVSIGLISYSAYLWHQPLFAFARLRLLTEPSKLTLGVLAIAAVFLAYFSWKYVEKPFRSKQQFTRKQIFAYSISGSVFFVLIGLAGNFTNKTESTSLRCSSQNIHDGLCQFGNLGTNDTIVLIGDSHIGHLSTSILKEYRDRYRIVFISCRSCYFGENLRFDELAENKKALIEAREKLQLLKKYRVKAVIRAQRWHKYGIDTADEITEAIADSYHFFGVSYERMIIVGSTQDVDYRCHAVKHAKLFDPGICKEFPESKASNEEFVRVTRQLNVPGKLRFVYPYERICPDGVCSVATANGLIYSDTHHLTELGASLVMEDIRKALNE